MLKLKKILLILFLMSSCKSLKLDDFCSIYIGTSIDDSICVCKARDMITGETLSEPVVHELSYCDRAIVFRSQTSWPELDAFLLNLEKDAREAAKKVRRSALQELQANEF